MFHTTPLLRWTVFEAMDATIPVVHLGLPTDVRRDHTSEANMIAFLVV